MSKKIKIRFVECRVGSSLEAKFSCQKKCWYGWKYIGYYIATVSGDAFNIIIGSTKEQCLKIVLDKHYKNCKKHIQIIEYPGVKIY